MSETQPPVTNDAARPTHDASLAAGKPWMLRFGGALGVAACFIGLAVFLAACAGIDAALKMAYIPLLLGAVGFVFTLVGALLEKKRYAAEDTHVLAAFFANCMGIIGGLVELTALMGWPTLSK